MNTPVNEIIFVGNDNVFILEYSSSDSYDFSATDKVVFELNGKIVNSTDNPEYFDYSGGGIGKINITFKLGAAGYVRADSGAATVTIFDPVNTNGLVFSDPLSDNQLNIKVI